MPSVEDAQLEQMSVDPWFSELELPARRALLARCELLHLGNHEFLFRQGDAPSGFFGLLTGALKVSTLREDGKEAVLAVLERGNWFGEASLIDGLPRTHDVTTAGPAQVLRVEQADFDDLMGRTGFAQAIARLQARRTRAIYANLEDAMLRSTRARIVRRLLRLALGDITIGAMDRRNISVTHDTLAMMLGMTRQTLALELKALELRGAIAQGYGRIEIVSMDALRGMERKE